MNVVSPTALTRAFLRMLRIVLPSMANVSAARSAAVSATAELAADGDANADDAAAGASDPVAKRDTVTAGDLVVALEEQARLSGNGALAQQYKV